MKKSFFSALFIGAITTVSMVAVQSCNSDIEDLKTRVSVLEGMTRELKADLQNAMVTGSTIITSSQAADGTWTLILSDGNEIVIRPTSGSGSAGEGGSGSTVTVTETADAFVITVDGATYAIPKTSSAAVNSLVYVPEYEDGLVLLGNDGATVSLLATPALTSGQLANAVFEIADARAVLTRAGADIIKVTGVAAEGDLLKVSLKGLKVTAGGKYVVAIKATVDGTAISSNYFTVAVAEDFSFSAEVLETPVMKEGTALTDLGEGLYRALIPNSAVLFLTGFNLKDYYQTLPSGNIAFQLAPAAEQNSKVQGKYELVKNSLKADGTFKFAGRPGTDFFDEAKNGILIYMTADDVVKNKIFWQIDNPIPGLGLGNLKEEFGNAPHMEYGYKDGVANDDVSQRYLKPGEQRIHFAELFTRYEDLLGIRHDGDKFVTAWNDGKMAATVGDEDVFYVEGNDLVLGDYGKALCTNSRGILWQSTQPSIISSNRRNLTEEERAVDVCGGSCNGEIIQGYDGISGDEFRNTFGVYFDEVKGDLVTTADYKGNGFRIAIGLRFEYDYGAEVISSGNLCYLFFNRRVSAPGVVDPAAR